MKMYLSVFQRLGASGVLMWVKEELLKLQMEPYQSFVDLLQCVHVSGAGEKGGADLRQIHGQKQTLHDFQNELNLTSK